MLVQKVTLWKLLFRYGSQGLVVAAPWLAPRLSARFPSESDAKVLLSLVGLILVLAYDAWDLYIPREQLRRFGKDYADKLSKNFDREDYLRLGTDVRLNVMYVAGVWRLSWFKWMANYGFVSSGQAFPDNQLFLLTWQGIAGRAVADRKVTWVDLRKAAPPKTFPQRWLFRNEFRMWAPQMKATRHVKAVLTVPLFRVVGTKQNPRQRLVGVINFDAISEKGADWLADDKFRKDMTEFLGDHGTFLAFLD